jgi:hypothetical protein
LQRDYAVDSLNRYNGFSENKEASASPLIQSDNEENDKELHDEEMQIDTSSKPNQQRDENEEKKSNVTDDIELPKFGKLTSENYYHKSEGYLRKDEEGNYVDVTEQAQLNNLA